MVVTKPRVFIVDDESYVREMLKMMISTLDYEVIGEASNGNEAIGFIKNEKPDIILLDTNMPFKTGDEVLEEVSDIIQETCVIIISIISDAEIVRKCVDLGVSYFVRKDTPIPKMMSIIQDTWKTFESKKKKSKINKYDLKLMLDEIKEDEMITSQSKKDLSQDDIKRFFNER